MQQFDKDRDHLNLLSVFHFVLGGLIALLYSFGLIHVVLGTAMAVAPVQEGAQGPPPAAFGVMFAVIGATVVLFGWGLGGSLIYSGLMMRKQRRRVFSLIVAGIGCLFMPLGTILGVFTIVVLVRESVVRKYEANLVR